MSEADDEPDDRQFRGRAAFLAVVLSVFFGGGAVIFLIFLTGGFFLDVLVIVSGLVLLGLVHYLLWGRGFDRSVQGEREELELQREAEEQEKSSRPPWERRF
jgi:hypothetical protein